MLSGMTRTDPATVVNQLCQVVRPIITSRITAGNSVASTRVALAVLAHEGVEAEPVAVDADILDGTVDSHRFVTPLITDGDDDEWPGWLVVKVGPLLVDLCLDSVTHPATGRSLRPAVIELPDDFWTGRQPVMRRHESGLLLSVVRDLDQDAWMGHPDAGADAASTRRVNACIADALSAITSLRDSTGHFAGGGQERLRLGQLDL